MSVLCVCIHSCCLINEYGRLISSDVLSIVCNQSQNTMCYFLLGWSNINSELYFLQYAKKRNMFFYLFIYFFFFVQWKYDCDIPAETRTKNWNITKAKTNCPFECPQVLTRNSLKVTAYKHTYALIEWTTIVAYNGLPPIRRETII